MTPPSNASVYSGTRHHDLAPRDKCHHRNQKGQQRARKPLLGVNNSRTERTALAVGMKQLYGSRLELSDEITLRHMHDTTALGHKSASEVPVGAAEPQLGLALACRLTSSLCSLKWRQEKQQQQQRQLEVCNQFQSNADDQFKVPETRAGAGGTEPPLASALACGSQPTLSPSDRRHQQQATNCMLESHRRARNSTSTTAKSNATATTTAPAKAKQLHSSSSTGLARNWQAFAVAVLVLLIAFTSSSYTGSTLTSAKSIEGSPTNSATSDKTAKSPLQNHLLQADEHETRANTDSALILTEASTATPTSTTTTSTRSPSLTTKFDDLIRGIGSLFTSKSAVPPATRPTTSAPTTTTTTTTTASAASAARTSVSGSSTLPARTTTTTTTTSTEAETVTESTTELPQDDSTGAGNDDYDAEDCQGISGGESEEGAKLTDHERLVNLQACLQKKVKGKLTAISRSTMALFDELSLSGGCSASLMTLMFGLGELKSYAFKFLDASAKIPSGVMNGLLSDFGDFDECLSIRSNPRVQPADEVDEGTFSGKYCMLTIRLNYHVKLAPNATYLDGIYPDGLFWDQLIRNYWTSKTTKGFQVGVCVPSRCNNDDIAQLYQSMAKSYSFQGEVMSCQDSNDLSRHQNPDALQLFLLCTIVALLGLTLVGTLVDRYQFCCLDRIRSRPDRPHQHSQSAQFAVQILVCFSIKRNWRLFLAKHNSKHGSVSGPMRLATGPAVCLAPGHGPASLRNCVDSIQSNLTQFTVASGASSIEAGSRHRGAAGMASSTQNVAKRSMSAIELNGQSDQLVGPRQPPSSCMSVNSTQESNKLLEDYLYPQLTVNISPREVVAPNGRDGIASAQQEPAARTKIETTRQKIASGQADILSHLSGLKLLVIVWITVGHSFLYPSANNYQHYRSIINMNITRDSVWFAATNFTLGIDMLLYMIGLIFVHKLASNSIRNTRGKNYLKEQQQQQEGARKSNEIFLSNQTKQFGEHQNRAVYPNSVDIVWLIFRKILRFWPTYLAVISLAIVVPLISNGPLWPEMVSHRLGDACRSNWWTNLLMANNFAPAADICLPSSWFVSVIMQCFLIGSIIAALARKRSLKVAVSILVLLLLGSVLTSFLYAYHLGVTAPAIRMDESFVLEIDDTIYRLYTNTFNNLGPFLVGMLGGIVLIKWKIKNAKRQQQASFEEQFRLSPTSKRQNGDENRFANKIDKLTKIICEFNMLFAISLLAILVLSSVFHHNYTQFWACVYWSCHRVGWAIVTGYLVHQCATGKWKLLKDLLSLSSFTPLSKLIFIAYLVYPIYIHIHSGLIRDGLHVSIYNMMNIYITRIVLTFATALALYLLVELPFCSIEEILIKKWLLRRERTIASKAADGTDKTTVAHPLLVVAPTVSLDQCPSKKQAESIGGEPQHNSKQTSQKDRAYENDVSITQADVERIVSTENN